MDSMLVFTALRIKEHTGKVTTSMSNASYETHNSTQVTVTVWDKLPMQWQRLWHSGWSDRYTDL